MGNNRNKKNVILSTGDIKHDYSIKGIIHAEVRINEKNLSEKGGWAKFRVSDAMSRINQGLSEAARNLKGDAVINITYSSLTLPNFEFVIIAYGTVVKYED